MVVARNDLSNLTMGFCKSAEEAGASKTSTGCWFVSNYFRMLLPIGNGITVRSPHRYRASRTRTGHSLPIGWFATGTSLAFSKTSGIAENNCLLLGKA